MPEADEVERLLAAQELVARLQVDVRVVVVVRAGVLVVVPAVDVHPHAAELVDDLLEPVEVHGDQVVDRQSRQVLHRQDGSRRAAARVRRVDAVAARRDVAGVVGLRARAVDRHVEVTREREQRDRLRRRIGTYEHQRVRERRPVRLDAGAVVVADHQRDRGLVRERDVERLRCAHDLRRVRAHGRDRLVEVQIGAACDGEAERREDDERPDHDPPEEAERGLRRRRRLPVAGDRAEGPWREDGLAVPVVGSAPDASLQCGPHTNVCGATKGARTRQDSRPPGPTSRLRRGSARASVRRPRPVPPLRSA